MTFPLAKSFTKHLHSIILNFLGCSSWQNKSTAQQLPHCFFLARGNQRPIGDCRIQNHFCSDYSTDGVTELCCNLRGFYGLSCCANCIKSILPFGVVVSSSLTPVSLVLLVRGRSCRIRARASSVFVCMARGSASALTPSCLCRVYGSYDLTSRYT